jgi:hypothetical protein
MQTATAYLRKNKVFVHPDARTTDGVWIFWLPVLMQDAVDGAELDAKILEALANSREGVPHPTDWTGLGEPLLQAAGVKSWNSFAHSANASRSRPPEAGSPSCRRATAAPATGSSRWPPRP